MSFYIVVYLGWPITPSYMSPNAGGRGRELRGLSQWVQLCTWSPKNKLWRSNFTFNLSVIVIQMQKIIDGGGFFTCQAWEFDNFYFNFFNKHLSMLNCKQKLKKSLQLESLPPLMFVHHAGWTSLFCLRSWSSSGEKGSEKTIFPTKTDASPPPPPLLHPPPPRSFPSCIRR